MNGTSAHHHHHNNLLPPAPLGTVLFDNPVVESADEDGLLDEDDDQHNFIMMQGVVNGAGGAGPMIRGLSSDQLLSDYATTTGIQSRAATREDNADYHPGIGTQVPGSAYDTNVNRNNDPIYFLVSPYFFRWLVTFFKYVVSFV